jgi:hypothetical protein
MSIRRPHRYSFLPALAVLCAGVILAEGLSARRPAGSPLPAAGQGFAAPESVRPGLRLTFYLMTGSLSGSLNGWIPDEEGDWEDKEHKRYSKERQGRSSHGLIQATVVGGSGGTVALAEPFYLFNGGDLTPVLNTSLDSLVTAESGGDLWMHPQLQARHLRQNPWTGPPLPGRTMARTMIWTDEAGRKYQATHIVILGDASRTAYVYDQATGYLLYLSRLSRDAPEVRERGAMLHDSVSYSTFLRFRGARQLVLPWLGRPVPESLRNAQALSYRGQYALQGQGLAPTPMALALDLQVLRTGADWMWIQTRSQAQGTIGTTESNSVNGAGSLPPLAVPPDVLAGLTVGQVIDRDPLTGFTVRVVNADAQYVALQTDGPRQSMMYVYDRARGLLQRRVSQDRNPATPQMVSVRDIRLTGIR